MATITRAHNYTEVQQAIRVLDPFDHSTCSAMEVSEGTIQWLVTGELPREDYKQMRSDFYDAEPFHHFYVVYSYSTPIGWSWFDMATQTRMRRIPATKYSATTSKQQTYVRANLPGKDA